MIVNAWCSLCKHFVLFGCGIDCFYSYKSNYNTYELYQHQLNATSGKPFIKMQVKSASPAWTLGTGSIRNSAQPIPSTVETRCDACRPPAGQYLNSVDVLTSNSDVESLERFPNHLPYRVPPPSRWKRRNLIRILTGLLCFVAAIVGTVGGAYFIANVMRGGMFRQSSAHNGRTIQKTETNVVT